MASVFQKSFSSGELAPPCYARCDLLKYATGARTMRNMFVGRHGGAYNRNGSIYRSQASDSTHRIRLISFPLPNSTVFQLEFGNLYVRILKDGVPVQTSVKDISTISKASAAVVTLKEYHSMIIGDQVLFASVGGMTQINGLTGTISAVSPLSITVNIDSTGFSSFTSGGTATPVTPRDIKYTTVYTEAQLREFTYGQQDSTLSIAHQSNFPLQLTYLANEYWTLTQTDDLVKPVIAATAITQGPITHTLFGVTLANATAGATYTNNGVTFTVVTTISSGGSLHCTSTNLPSPTGSLVKTGGTGDSTINFFQAIPDFTQPTWWGVTVIAQDTFEESLIALWGSSAVSGSQTLLWGAVTGAIQYNVYRGSGTNLLGFLAITGATTYTDDFSLTPDFTSPPPIERTIFKYFGSGSTANALPAAVGYFQQRKYYGNMGPPITSQGPPATLPTFPNYSDRMFGSRIGSPTYFNQQRPTPDDGMLSFRMLNRVPQEIRHFLDIGKLAVFTSQGEWVLGGDPSTGGMTPSTINPTNFSQNGSGFTPPLAVGSMALYIQYNSILNTSIVRTFGFEFQVEGYRGDDVTIYSSHLTDGHQLPAWAYQKLPHPIVWTVRDDGIMLGLTFVPEQQVLAWHRHDFTNGLVEDVISSGGQIYLAIKRVINGSTVRYIERLASRSYTSIVDAVFVDSCSTYDGRNTDSTKTMTLSGGTTWAYDETFTITSSASFFSSASVGRFIHLRGPNNELIRFKIAAQSSGTVATGSPDKTVPASMRTVALSNWAEALVTVTGLSHLEGQQVSVLGDGFVVSSPNNDQYPTLTVTSGQITLSTGDVGYGVVQVGLPIVSDLETLNIDNPQGPTMVDKKKLINKVSIWLEGTRGGWVGGSPPDDDSQDALEGLETGLDELKYRYDEGYDDPSNLITRVAEINIQSQWNSHGRVFVRQVDPLPIGVLAIAPEGFIRIGVP